MIIEETLRVDPFASSSVALHAPFEEQEPEPLIEGDLHFEIDRAREEGLGFEHERVQPARAELAAYGRSLAESTARRTANRLDDRWATLRFNLAVRLCALGAARSDRTSLKKAARLFGKAAAVAEDERLRAKAQYGLGTTLLVRSCDTRDLIAAVDGLARAADSFKALLDSKWFALARNNQGCAKAKLAERCDDADAFRESAKIFFEADVAFSQAGFAEGVSRAKSNYGVALWKSAERTGEVADLGAAAFALPEIAGFFEKTGELHNYAHARYLHGLVMRDCSKLNPQSASSQQAALASFTAAAAAFHDCGDVSASSCAQARRGVALLDLATAERGEVRGLEEATQALTVAVGGHRYANNLPGAAWASLHKGKVLMVQGFRSKVTRHLKDAADAFSVAEEDYASCGNDRDRAIALAYRANALVQLAWKKKAKAAWRIAIDAWEEVRAACSAVDSASEVTMTAEWRLGTALSSCAKQTQDPGSFSKAADILGALAERYAESANASACAVVWRDQGFALLDWAELVNNDANIFRKSAQAYAAAAESFRAIKRIDALGQAELQQGYALGQLAERTTEPADFEASIAVSSRAATLCLACGAVEGHANSLQNQGVALVSYASSSASSSKALWRLEGAAIVFAGAAESYAECGLKESRANALHSRSVALYLRAEAVNEAVAWRVAADAASDSVKSYAEIGHVGGCAKSQHRVALALLQLAKCTRRGEDFESAARALEIAVERFAQAGEHERVAQARKALEFALEAAKFDKLPSPVEQRERTTTEGAIADAPKETTPTALREKRYAQTPAAELLEEARRRGLPEGWLARAEELMTHATAAFAAETRDFTDATLDDLVATLPAEGKLPCAPPRGLSERLVALVRDKQQEATRIRGIEDKRAFAEKVNRVLDGYSLLFKLSGGELARLNVTPYKDLGTFQFGLARGGSRGFRKESVVSIVHKALLTKELQLFPKN